MNTKRVFQVLLVLATSVLLCSFAVAQDRIVYHIDDAAAQATNGLRNIRNHLDVLMDGAKDTKDPNIDYDSLVSSLKARGVTFEICEITLRNRNLKKEQFNMDATFTPSGVVRIGRLQSRENFAYIKP